MRVFAKEVLGVKVRPALCACYCPANGPPMEDPDLRQHESDVPDNTQVKTPYSTPQSDDVQWVVTKGPTVLRKLRRWGLDNGKLLESEQKLLYWTAHDLDKKKKPNAFNARKVKRIFENAVRKGFVQDK